MRIGFIIFVFLVVNATAQTGSELNELFKTLNSAPHDSLRINTLIKIGNLYQNSNPDSAIYYHLKAKDLSKKTNDPLRIIKSFNELLWDYLIKSDFESALKMYDEARVVIDKTYKTGNTSLILKVKRLEGACITNVASVYKETGQYNKALDYYFKAAAINNETGNKDSKASTYTNIATVYSQIGDLVKATEYNYKALKIFEETGNKLYQAGVLGNLGLVYSKQEDHKKALEFHLRSQKIYLELDYKPGQATNYENMGIEYAYLKNAEMSLGYFFKSLKINEELGNIFAIGQSYGNIGISYTAIGDTLMVHGRKEEAMKKYELALGYYLKAVKIAREIGNKQGEGFNLMSLGSLYVSLGNYTTAAKYNRQAQIIAMQIGSLNDLKEVYFVYYKINLKSGREAEALKNYKLYIRYRDSIVNEENTKASMEQEMKFIYEKKAATDSVKIEEERKITQAKFTASQASLKEERTLRFGLYGGIFVLMIFAAVMYNRFTLISKQKNLINRQKQLVEHQKHLVEEKQKEIIDSIHYAKRIQTAMLTSEKYIERVLNVVKRG